MLEKIDLSVRVEKEVYKAAMEEMEAKLGLLQRRCKEAGIPVMILFEGMGAAGKGVQINRLIQAMDPRGFSVFASNRPTEEEHYRPFLWRYWTKTPANGRTAIYDRGWYRSVQVDRFDGVTEEGKLAKAFQDILSFEKQLSDGGTVIIKLFLYISKAEQKKRFKKLANSKETAWRVSESDWNRNKEYDKYLQINEEMLEKTDTEFAPWTIIEATDKNYAAMKVMSTVTSRLEYELEKKAAEKEAAKNAPKKNVPPDKYKNGVLSGVDLSKKLSRSEYKKELSQLQKRIQILHSEIYRLRIPVILGFEGWDAGGKGGAIKRLTSNLDPRGYQVNPTASPNDIEKVHHYLWRFWNNVPKAGHIAIFDRTWYGRVMVERIEGFCSEADWKRAYQEINEMEAHMANAGAVVLKFWLHIDKDEQERRFKERMENPAKQWKITDEDWRNREKWDLYEEAVNEMLVRTSTTYAPWVVVEGNDKYYARVKVVRTVVEALEKKIKEVKKAQKEAQKRVSRVLVVGGGPAGMMAAAAAGNAGHKVSLYEKNEKLGKKLYLTGKGRCNVTNTCLKEEFFQAVVSNPKFLYSSYHQFDNQEIMKWLTDNGCPLKIERGNRVFPVSDKSSDVIRALERILKKNQVEVCLHEEVKTLLVQDGQCVGIRKKGADGIKEVWADAVIIATGGLSYPSTGSTGDGISWAKDFGHSVKTPLPALVPFLLQEEEAKELQGLSLRNIEIRVFRGEKERYREFGELVFTHFGVSGPVILSASSFAARDLKKGALGLSIDLKPALSMEQLDSRILRDFSEEKNKQFKNSLSHLLPAKMIPIIIKRSRILPDKQVNEITKEERHGLAGCIKDLRFTITGTRDFNEAIITQGGVSVKEVNPSTMESKRIPGLYFAGEVLDLDAVTGGFNLQIAWSSGWTAGSSVR